MMAATPPSSKDGENWCRGKGDEEWTDWKKVEHVKFSNENDDVTLIGGVHAGYNWQSGARVFGVEGDVSFGDGVDYLASARARLGYARDNLLLYVTGGVAFAGFDNSSVLMSGNSEEAAQFRRRQRSRFCRRRRRGI